jgi:flavin-dependent dehydrogenase
MSRRPVDVVVVGGGPAGAATATVLAGAGRSVVLLERSTAPAFTPGEALPPPARPLLRELGALQLLTEGAHLPAYGTASVWGAATPRHTDFVQHPYGAGWHLDRARFDAALRRHAAAAGADLREGVRLRSMARHAGGWRLTTAGPHPAALDACWLVDATGRAAVVARAQGVRRRGGDRLVAAVMRLNAPPAGAPPDRCRLSRIEATPDGWCYTAPVPGQGRVLACLADAGSAAAQTARTAPGLARFLEGTSTLGAFIAAHGYTIDGSIRVVAAGSSRLERWIGPGWLAVGDAALAGDPILGQGMLSALYSGILAGRAILRALEGDVTAIEGYAAKIAALAAADRRAGAGCYAAEQRWPDRPFWRVRHEAQPV